MSALPAGERGTIALLHVMRDRLAGREDNPYFDRFPRDPGVTRRYLIATTGRSGSTLLCSRIAEYGALGFPNEFLNEVYISQFERLFPTPSHRDFERFVLHHFSSPGGVFGLKVDWWRFDLARRVELLRSLYEPLDLVIWLRRDDFVAQAVSLTLAVATGIWHDRDVGLDGSDLTLEERQRAAPYDAAAIETHARNTLTQEYAWARFFESCGAPVLDLSYETVAADPDAAVAAIGDALELDMPRRSTPPRMKKIGSGVGEEWRARFAAEHADFISFWTEHRGEMTASA
jgi:LPS sulfotransferase NodH